MKEEIKYWYLRNHKLFDQLSDAEVDGLCIISSYKKGNKNDIIFFSENDKKRLYTIKQGILKICHHDKDGKEVITEKLVSFQQKYTDLIFKDVHTRVIDFFKQYAAHHAKKVNNTLEMEIILTHQEIADYTAASRQSVTRVINKLIVQGKIIYEGRKKVIIPDLTKL
jgi:CRP-like cAMP-binding protein